MSIPVDPLDTVIPQDRVNSWFQTALVYVANGVLHDWGNAVWSWFANLFTVPLAILTDPALAKVLHVTLGMSLGILPVAIGLQVLRHHLDHLDGSSTTPPEVLMKRCLLAGLGVTGTNLIAWAGLTYANLLVDALRALGVDLNLLRTFFLNPGAPGFGVLLLMLILLVGAALSGLQRMVMDAELTVLLVLGPLAGVSLIRGDGGLWASWLRELASLLLTPVVQLLVTWFFVRTFALAGPFSPSAALPALAFLWVLVRTPGWVRSMIYSAGIRGAAGGAAGAAGRFLFMRQLIRTAITKGA